jgi:hypothetical protein
MDNSLARHLALTVHRSKEGLDHVLELLQNHCDDTDINSFRAGIAVVDGKYQALLKLIFAGHPGLEHDLDEKRTKFGRPL